MKTLALKFLPLFVSFILGIFVHSIWISTMDTTVRSNRYALEESMISELENIYSKTGKYPETLDELKIDWIKSAERRENLMMPFYYYADEDSYILWWPKQ